MVNEEMYEEEDDDLPIQYRRLTAHLQTGSADFNRRLSAYLTNHVAMRSALDQAITNSYAQQYPNAPQFAHNQSMYPSPFNMPQNMPQQQSPTSYQPYPSPGTPSYRPDHQARSGSGSLPTPAFSPTTMSAPSPPRGTAQMIQRRTSSSSLKSSSHSPTSTKSTPQLSQPRSAPAKTSPLLSRVKQEEGVGKMQAPPQPPSQSPNHPFQNMNGYPNDSPFSTALPAETQMLLGGALDPNDPMTAMLMAGSENFPQWNYNQPSSTKPRSFHPSFDGMSATLAPSALDMSPGHQQYSTAPSGGAAPSLGRFDDSMNDLSKSQMYSGNSCTASGTATPGADAGWDAFINDSSWGENVT